MRKIIRLFLPALFAVFLVSLYLVGLGDNASALPDVTSTVYIPLVFKNFQGYGTLEGQVVEAGDGTPIPNATVCANDTCTTTNASGEYSLDKVYAGRLQLKVTAPDKIMIYEPIDITRDQTREMFLAMVEPTTTNYLQIVLTWGPPWDAPLPGRGDLDAHLYITNTSWLTGNYHIISSDDETYGDCSASPFACYANVADIKTGYGPEAIDIAQVEVGNAASFGVLNYDAGQTGVPGIDVTEAAVRVFNGNYHLAVFHVEDASGGGDLWYVFDITESGGAPALTTRNCLNSYSGDDLPSCNGVTMLADRLQTIRPPKP